MGSFAFFKICLVVLSGWLVTGTAQANQIRITAAFTSFTGIVLGGNSFITFCPADSCGGPPSPPSQICPDAGCDSGVGLATNYELGGSPTNDTTSQLSFRVSGNERNQLIFRANKLLSQEEIFPHSRFKLGTLTFTNGSWTGDADIGFSIVARDTTEHESHRFTGFLHMGLTLNDGTALQNADFVTLLDATGNAVKNPLTLQTLGSLRAYELGEGPTGSNTVTADLFGQFGSLDLTDFANPVGGGFLDSSVTAELGNPAAVPEPGTQLLLVLGLLAVAGKCSRRFLARG